MGRQVGVYDSLMGTVMNSISVVVIGNLSRAEPYLLIAQVGGETWEEFLPWATYTTTDPFEKVWQFYWTKKLTYPMPLPFNLKNRASASMGTNDPRWGITHFAYVYEPSPSGKWGVLVIRRRGANRERSRKACSHSPKAKPLAEKSPNQDL